MKDNCKKSVYNKNIEMPIRSNSFDSFENSITKKDLNYEEKLKFKIKNNWIPLEKKRRKREMSVCDNYSKSPQLSDVLILISKIQNINIIE